MGKNDAEVQDAIEFAAREMAEEEHKREHSQHDSDGADGTDSTDGTDNGAAPASAD